MYNDIVDVLKYKTKKGDQTWEEDPSSPIFLTAVPIEGNQVYKVGIYRMEEEGMFLSQLPGSICAELTFLDVDNKVFDKVSIYSTSSSDYKNLSELYELARSAASGTADKLEKILKSLKSNNPHN